MTVRFTVVLEGREYPVEVTEDLQVRIADRTYEPEVRSNDGFYDVGVDDHRFEFHLAGRRLLYDGTPLRADFRGYLHPSTAQEALGEGVAAVGEVRAPMPGRVVAVTVEAGDRVALGTPLLILEAMKMQNEIPAPVEGTVREVQTAPGQAVGRDDLLLVIE